MAKATKKKKVTKSTKKVTKRAVKKTTASDQSLPAFDPFYIRS